MHFFGKSFDCWLHNSLELNNCLEMLILYIFFFYSYQANNILFLNF